MKTEIFLIALLSAATISALSLEGYKCSDHVILTGDLMTPIRTVRICGVPDYAAPPSYVSYQTSTGTEKTAYPLMTLDGFFNSINSANPSLSSASVPPQLSSNELQQLSAVIFQAVPILTRFYEAPKHPSSGDIDLNSSDLKEKYQVVEQKLSSIAEDASQTKRSYEEAAASVKNIFDALMNTKAQRDIDVNVHFEPSFEALLKRLLQVVTVDMTTEKPVDVQTPKPTAVSNESNSDENDSEEHENTEETTEDYNSWIRLHFGPVTTTPTTLEEATEDYSDESFYSTGDESSEEHSLIAQQLS
ncbi:uncharacterized protein LOC126755121 [Bactrocera neohumeralis]|uniref:uncharacterized protein LOC126755121 n=1 Tax=Bactrocera neohumeralis TaxID=98809 RepID=UPI00216627B7|nr:uncharacterized protein LOC126755121 [Bactrocera neohumeralis]